MSDALGKRYARGEFDHAVIDGEEVEVEILQRGYGFVLREYRYLDGKPSQWGVWFPLFTGEMRMSTDQAEWQLHSLGRYIDRAREVREKADA